MNQRLQITKILMATILLCGARASAQSADNSGDASANSSGQDYASQFSGHEQNATGTDPYVKKVKAAASGGGSDSSSGEHTGGIDDQPGVAECAAAQHATNSMCNTASLVGINDPTAGAAAEVAVGQLASMAASVGSDQAQICKNQKTVNELLAFLSGVKGTWCEIKIRDCNAKCNNATTVVSSWPETDAMRPNALRHIQNFKSQCNANQANVIGSGIQAAMSLFNVASLGHCQSLTSATPTPFVITPTNCSDPTAAASNIVCRCQANPSDPVCPQNFASTNGLSGTASTAGPASPSANYNADLSGLGDGTPVDTRQLATKQDGQNATPPGGGGGGLGGGGGAAGGLAGAGGEEGNRHAEDKSVITGVSTGSGGGGGGGLFSGGTGGGPAGRAGAGTGEGGAAGFNISRFLPKAGGVAGRDPASAVIGQDGVTGANGLSLFEKVNAQYQNQSSRLFRSP